MIEYEHKNWYEIKEVPMISCIVVVVNIDEKQYTLKRGEAFF
jgi:hypothetical protein